MQKLRSLLDANKTLRAPPGQRPAAVERMTWDRVVGPRIAARSEPYRLEHGTLLVRVTSSGWANELSLLSEPIVAQLRAEGIEISAIRFVVGKVALSPPRTRGPAVIRPPADAPIPEELAKQLAAVSSPELREALGRAAAKSLALARVADTMAGLGLSGIERRARHRPAKGETQEPTERPTTQRPTTTLPEQHPTATTVLTGSGPTRPWIDRAPQSVVPPPAAITGHPRSSGHRTDERAPDSSPPSVPPVDDAQ